MFFRQHKESMIKLRNLLSNSSKARRHHRNHLNIQVTVLTWFTEFLGFFCFLLGSFILGHTNTTTTFILQTFSAAFNFIILPGLLSVSHPKLKHAVADSIWYQKLMHKINPIQNYDGVEDDEEDEEEPEIRGEGSRQY